MGRRFWDSSVLVRVDHLHHSRAHIKTNHKVFSYFRQRRVREMGQRCLLISSTGFTFGIGTTSAIFHATTSCKIVETLSLKNTFSSFQCPPYLEFKPFQLPLPSPPFSVDCLSSQHFFVLLATLMRGGGGLQCER